MTLFLNFVIARRQEIGDPMSSCNSGTNYSVKIEIFVHETSEQRKCSSICRLTANYFGALISFASNASLLCVMPRDHRHTSVRFKRSSNSNACDCTEYTHTLTHTWPVSRQLSFDSCAVNAESQENDIFQTKAHVFFAPALHLIGFLRNFIN